jgi:hypothetical protein
MVGIYKCHTHRAQRLGAKFKNLRRVLKVWHAQLSNINVTIQNNKVMLFRLDAMEEFRDLSLKEWNFRNVVRENIEKLLKQ